MLDRIRILYFGFDCNLINNQVTVNKIFFSHHLKFFQLKTSFIAVHSRNTIVSRLMLYHNYKPIKNDGGLFARLRCTLNLLVFKVPTDVGTTKGLIEALRNDCENAL